MSLLPYMFDYDIPWPRRVFDQNFGVGLRPEDLMVYPSSPVSLAPRYRSFWPKDVGSSIKSDKDKFQVNIDVQHFSPEEITVKTTDGFIIVEGKHEERKDEHGYISRQFLRRFKLPEDSNPDAVESRLSSDGVLTVVAPRKVDAAKGERAVPIAQTGPVRKILKDDTETEVKEEKK